MPRLHPAVLLAAALAAGGCGDEAPAVDPPSRAATPTASASPPGDQIAAQQAQADGEIGVYLARVSDQCAQARRRGSLPPLGDPGELRRHLQRAIPEAGAVMTSLNAEPPAPLRGPVGALRQANERLLQTYSQALAAARSGEPGQAARLVRAAEDEVSAAARAAGLPPCAPR